jgi:Protein of unknown function (DUF1365)
VTEVHPAIYVGKVVHQRLQPVSHRLEYTVASFLVDVDKLDTLPSLLRYNGFGLFGLYDGDHGMNAAGGEEGPHRPSGTSPTKLGGHKQLPPPPTIDGRGPWDECRWWRWGPCR